MGMFGNFENFDEIGESHIDGVERKSSKRREMSNNPLYGGDSFHSVNFVASGFNKETSTRVFHVAKESLPPSQEEMKRFLDKSYIQDPQIESLSSAWLTEEEKSQIQDNPNFEIYTVNDKGQKDGPAVRYTETEIDNFEADVEMQTLKTFYKDGKEDGPFKLYKNGRLAQEGSHKEGKLDGILKTYRKGGKVDIEEFQDGKKVEEKEKEQAKENVEAKTGYSAEALAEVGKEVLKAHDGVEKQDIAQAADGVKQTSNNAVKDMLSKMTDSKVAEDIVKAGLGSEHLSTSVGGLEAGAKAMQETLEASETSQKSMYERLKEASDMTHYPQLRAKYQERSADPAVPMPQILDRNFKVEKPKPQSLAPNILQNAAKNAAANR